MKKLFIFLLLVLQAAVMAKGISWQISQGSGTLDAGLVILPGNTVYSESIVFDITDAEGKKVVPNKAPAKQELYGSGTWVWRFSGKAPFKGSVEYQGCGKDESGTEVCYPPEKIEISSNSAVKEVPSQTAEVAVDIPQFKVEKSAYGSMSKAEFLAFLGNGKAADTSLTDIGIAAMFLLALLGGLGLNLTPCVLPMMPINLAIIGAAGNGRKTGLLRGLCYGAGMAFAYGVLGIVVVLTGTPFGSLNSSWLFNVIIAAVFFVLAIAMAGFINFDLSRFRRFDVSKWGKTREAAAFLLGGVSALLAGACVAPVVVTVLLFASSNYNDGNVFALFLPFVLGIGMALPWPFAGAGLAILPRPDGKIMVGVKSVFVALIFAAGLYYLYTGWNLLPGRNDTAGEFAKLESVLEKSRKNGKPVLIDFWAPWCKNCLAMEKDVLKTPEVEKSLEQYNFVKFNARDIRDERVLRLLEYCKVPGLPGYVVAVPAEKR